MPKYLCIQRSSGGACDTPSPAQMEEMFSKFNAWREKFHANIVDMGGKLGDGKVATPDGVSDGPFVETKEIAGGYMIIEADNIEEAIQVAHESPGVNMPGSSVEVREIVSG